MWRFVFASALLLHGLGPVDCACETRTGWHCAGLSTSYVLHYQVQADDRLYLNAVVEDHSGWIGIGLNGNGGMKGASVMTVRKDGEEWVVEDRHSVAYATPIMDEQQDVALESVEEMNGKINVTISLPINSCDQHDYPVVDLQHTVIWALGSSHTFAYHGQTADVNRGATMLNFISGPQDSVDPADSFTVDIKMPNVRIEGGPRGQDATNPYVCAAFDLSQLGIAEGSYHVTKYEPLIQEGNHPYLHHMIGNPCFDGAPRYVTDSDPTTWFQVDCEAMIDCSGANFVWAVGSGPIFFPPEAGFPVETGLVQYFAIQVHYYNPSLTPDLTDSSGFRLTMTPTLRANNVGVYTLNAGTSNRMTNPLEPGLPEVWRGMQIPPRCNDDSWPTALDEVNVLAIFHHEHELGTKMEINLIRNGTNLGPLRSEKMYDFKHQNFVQSNFPVLKRTDTLDVRCKYDTSSKTEPVDFGDLTQEEMCFGGMYYYPAVADDLSVTIVKQAPPQPSVPEGCHTFRHCLGLSKRGPRYKDHVCKQGMAGKSACEHMVAGSDSLLMLWGRGGYSMSVARGTLVEVCVEPGDKWVCSRADACEPYVNVCNELFATCANSTACTSQELEAFAQSFCTAYCDGETWPDSEVPATDIIPYNLQEFCIVEQANGKSAAELALLRNPIQMLMFVLGNRPGSDVWNFVVQNGGWDALFPTMMDLCTHHDFSSFTTGVGAAFGWNLYFSTEELAMQLLIEWWSVCPNGCTQMGTCTETELEEFATLGAAYHCTYRQFYGYPSIYPNLVKPAAGFAEPTHLTCAEVRSEVTVQETMTQLPFFSSETCSIGTAHVCAQGIEHCKAVWRANALCPKFGICNGSYPMSTVCQHDWTSGWGWGYEELANEFHLCFTEDMEEDDEELWLGARCSSMCQDVASDSSAAVACARQRHVFERITSAPSPACSPRGVARRPMTISTTGTIASTTVAIGSGESDSNVDSVGTAPCLTLSWSVVPLMVLIRTVEAFRY